VADEYHKYYSTASGRRDVLSAVAGSCPKLAELCACAAEDTALLTLTRDRPITKSILVKACRGLPFPMDHTPYL
jgi:hypothetical protein